VSVGGKGIVSVGIGVIEGVQVMKGDAEMVNVAVGVSAVGDELGGITVGINVSDGTRKSAVAVWLAGMVSVSVART